MIINALMTAVIAFTPGSYLAQRDGTLPPPPQAFCKVSGISPTVFTYSCNYPRKVYVYRKFDGQWRLIGTL